MFNQEEVTFHALTVGLYPAMSRSGQVGCKILAGKGATAFAVTFITLYNIIVLLN